MNCNTTNNKKPLSVYEQLQKPYIGFAVLQDDFSKLGSLPIVPSYTDTLRSCETQKQIIVYQIDGYITSPSQYHWVSNIKLGIKDFIFTPITFIDDFVIADSTEITNNIYTIKQLSKAFKAPIVIYPKIMYPPNKKALYRHLCWYGARLIHQNVFTREALVSAALLMNKKLTEKYSNKDLHKKALGAYIWLVENMDGFKVKLNSIDLKKAHRQGAITTNAKRYINTKRLVDEAIATGNYTKPNGKVNKSALAKDLNMYRRTLDKYISSNT